MLHSKAYMNIILFEKADEVTFSEGFIIMPVNLQNHKDNAKCSVRTSILYPSVLPPALKQVDFFIKPSKLSKIKNINVEICLKSISSNFTLVKVS